VRKDLKIKSKSLGGSSDLVFMAPIKEGIVSSLDSVTYKTRLLQLMRTLNAGRTSSHEYLLMRSISDSVERTGKIHSVRVLILEADDGGRDKVLLAVTFDGGWESYLRVLWQKVGYLLDVIFCNTDGHVSALDHTFEEWAGWVDKIQHETNFFYGMPQLTPDDVQYLKAHHELNLKNQADHELDLKSVRLRLRSAEDQALELAAYHPDGASLQRYTEPIRTAAQSMVGLYSLSNLYAPMTNDGRMLHAATQVLLLEFVHILRNQELSDFSSFRASIDTVKERFGDEIEWLLSNRREPFEKLAITRLPPPPLPTETDEIPNYDSSDVQGGIINAYESVKSGWIVLIQVDTPEFASALLERLTGLVTKEDTADKSFSINIALTYEGLRAAGLTEKQLALFPQDFRQGMEARASILGDLHTNHPRRWRLPERNWTTTADTGISEALTVNNSNPFDKIELSTVHIVMQMRSTEPNDAATAHFTEQVKRLLTGFDKKLNGRGRILSVQPMARLTQPDTVVENGNAVETDKAIEHFGYVDGNSDPTIDPQKKGNVYRNQIHLGELLLGYANSADQAPIWDDGSDQNKLFKNSTFLVLRKLYQDVEAFHMAVYNGIEAAGKQGIRGVTAEDIYAKMMGRTRYGDALIKPAPAAQNAPAAPTDSARPNDFDFSSDLQGSACPFHSHIRRANPRVSLATDRTETNDAQGNPPDKIMDLRGKEVPLNLNSEFGNGVPELSGARFPRIVRRGMSYGPLLTDRWENLKEERGLMFMAYNASISEQFEVIQRWLSGGNSSGSFSGVSDPIIGVPRNGEKRYFRFEVQANDEQNLSRPAKVLRIALDGPEPLEDGAAPNYLEDARPFVRLEWGSYLFTPSITALRFLSEIGENNYEREIPWNAEYGEPLIKQLKSIPDKKERESKIKELLEDSKSQDDWVSASVLAAIREKHDGLLQINELGTIVATPDLVNKVLGDDALYSVSGYLERMQDSIGEIYLGLDKSPDYDKLSKAVNAALMSIKKKDAFNLAQKSATEKINELIDNEKRAAQATGAPQWELVFAAREVIDAVLGDVCTDWFGLPTNKDNQWIVPGGSRWDFPLEATKPVRYPGDFTAPSRYLFQPWPGESATNYGQDYGTALKNRFEKYTDDLLKNKKRPLKPVDPKRPIIITPAPIAKVIFDLFEADPQLSHTNKVTKIATTTVGALMGFLPTLDGNLKLIIQEWLKENTFADLRLKHHALTDQKFEAIEALMSDAIHHSMHVRSTPEYLWRRATSDHDIISNGTTVKIKKGEKVIAALASVNHLNIEKQSLCPYTSFGGNRKPVQPGTYNTHACPGYDAAQGILLGTLSALLAVDHSMRNIAGSLTFRLQGPTEYQVAVAAPADSGGEPSLEKIKAATIKWVKETLTKENIAKVKKNAINSIEKTTEWRHKSRKDRLEPVRKSIAKIKRKKIVKDAANKNSVLFLGDSWARGYPTQDSDLAKALEAIDALNLNPVHQGAIPGQTRLEKFSAYGNTLAGMNGKAGKVARYLDGNLGPKTKAIIISGGGNDVVQKRLIPYLKPWDVVQGQQPDVPRLKSTFESIQMIEMRAQYVNIIKRIRKASSEMPIIIHGYAHPVVDGRWLGVSSATSWLWEPLATKGYFGPHDANNNDAKLPKPSDVVDKQGWDDKRRAAFLTMKEVIDKFNEMLETLKKTEANDSGFDNLYYVDLREVVTSKDSLTPPDNYTDDWQNELHPSKKAYAAMALKIADVLKPILKI
jgi:deferrochelatase/peroxidase EfeB/lysophospholipase L1-like esterase